MNEQHPQIKRYYYASSITDFLSASNEKVLAELERGSREFVSLYGSQGRAWEKELQDLRPLLGKYSDKGSVIFEYTIPRLGRRIDVVLLLQGIVFVLEYKAFKEEFQSADRIQVFDYALDLKNFHKDSRNRVIVPILIMTDAEARENELVEVRDNIYQPLLCNTETLPETIQYCLDNIETVDCEEDKEWINSPYEPTPSIIEAVTHMYQSHTVRDLAKRGSEDNDFFKTCDSIKSIIKETREKQQKAICFVTGVPGAGKTLVGLDIASEFMEDECRAVYLSGNGPLVEVLCEALARDEVKRAKESRQQKIREITKSQITKKEQTGRIRLLEKATTKKEAHSKVQAIIQMVHRYRKACLEGIKESNGQIVQDINSTGSKNNNYIPVDHVAIFDEAQRAWTKNGLAKFMKEKHSWNDFPYSEPEFLISCIDRHTDWGVIVCLVGGGQEINHDEAGIGEWIEALNRRFPDWHVYISENLHDSEYMAGNALSTIQTHKYVHSCKELHLAVSRRSFKAERLASFVKALLDIDVDTAKSELKNLEDYPIYLTRDLDSAKNQLRQWAKGSSDRYGLLVSSKAERLKPLSIDVRVKPSVTAYFLNGPDDIRSSLFLEDAVSEFDVQGLELDWSCLVWDADFRFQDGYWKHYSLGSKKADDDNSILVWKNINDPNLRAYQKNAYRVLLTRARQGLVICIPKGDTDIPPKDKTRLPEYYNSTYDYLHSLGIKDLEEIKNKLTKLSQ